MEKIFKKGIASILALLLLALYPLPANAAQTTKEMTAALQNRYGMKISFVSDYSEKEKQALLEQIDSVFAHIGTAFVREVVSVYTKNGYTATLRLERILWGDQIGLFGVSKKNATLKIMTYNGTDESTEKLDSYSLVHEFGHMVHYAFDIKKGSGYVKKKWDACGTGVYATDYASSSFREDFAETFACVVTSDYFQAGLLEAIEADPTGVLKKKVDCLDSLLGEFSNFSTIQKMYGFTGIGASCINRRVSVNGRITEVSLYNIKGNNYFKLRDLAMLINGTEKQFEVYWDTERNSISLTSGTAYTEVGGELENSAGDREKAIPATARIYIDNVEIYPTAYKIKGNNYFKLRDIAKALDFRVDWEIMTMTLIIDTSAKYVDE